MHKTVAEAEQFIQALLPRVSSGRRRRGRDLPAVYRAGGDGRLGARARGCRCLPRTCTRPPGGVHRRGLGADAERDRSRTGVILGHSERRELFGETDRALQLKVPAALRGGALPILCVGETEEERERGDTERKLRHQVQEDLQGRDRASRRGRDRLRADLGDRDRAGRDAGAGPGRDRVRAGAGRRPLARAGATQTRVLYGGSVKPDNAAELLALPDVDGALVGGASLDPESFAAIVAAAG